MHAMRENGGEVCQDLQGCPDKPSANRPQTGTAAIDCSIDRRPGQLNNNINHDSILFQRSGYSVLNVSLS